MVIFVSIIGIEVLVEHCNATAVLENCMSYTVFLMFTSLNNSDRLT